MGEKHMYKIVIVFGVILALALFLYWNNKSIVVTNYQIRSENGELPKAFLNYRVTQVSDLQSEYFGDKQSNLLEKVSATSPDIIVFTGDLMDRNHTNYQAALDAMSGLVKIAPVYYTYGNHELALPENEMSDLYGKLEKLGVKLIFDKAVRIEKDGETINLVGISEQTIYAMQENPMSISDKVSQLTKNLNEEEYTILIAHEPQYIDEYGTKKVDLIFAGHAHGGQIRLPFTDGLFSPGQGVLPKLASGVHKSENSTMVISRGLGNSVFPFRIFNRPEIISVTLS